VTASVTPDLILGVDGGNTKTVALVARSDGTIVGAGRVLGCADIYAAPLADALAVIERAVDDALASAGARGRALAAPTFSLAGADWPEDHDLLEGKLRSRWDAAHVVNDAIGALRAAIPEGPGVVVVCGTGTATGARGPGGRTWHTSFWQQPQAARELGTETLRAICRTELGIDPSTDLVPRVLAALGASTVAEVLHRATARAGTGYFDPAVLASVLLDAAEAGDDTARRIVVGHGRALGEYAVVAARRVGITDGPFLLALAGGVIRHPTRLLPDAIVQAVVELAPAAEPVKPTLEPAVGALLLAFDRRRIEVTPAVEQRLRGSLPPATLFDTLPQPGG
jgi:N-acetylglucosamine kinase-like BadF-type ATPase